MAQYRPCGRSAEIEELSARLKSEDFETAYRAAIEEGITRLDKPKRVFNLW